ncbi:putative zinc finger protein [Orchesella cincta]|uniref:Putative zinc finger protein n=1 Tax=Orchesella cincta TaxID=48709 RepID=A0A1D2M974_ORCCI|nr:putative zinc finger protein [Orchesella cincta]
MNPQVMRPSFVNRVSPRPQQMSSLTTTRRKRKPKKDAHGRQKCPVCNKLLCKGSLRNHMNTHTGEKPYSCSVCGAAFVNQAKLKRHSAIHSEEKNYKCPSCPKSFKTPDSLRTHKVVFHNKSSATRAISAESASVMQDHVFLI